MSAYPLYNWNLEPSISFAYYNGTSGGVVGNPALAVDANQNTYFAAVVAGQNPTASPSAPSKYWTYNNIVVGSTDKNGNLLWYRFFLDLIVAANQQQVSLVIGNNNDLYVAFVTPAAVSNRYNMSMTPSWCPPLYPEAGVEGTNDIVLARINYSNTSQTVAWVIQNARLNSVYDETAPQLAIDTTTGLLYITFQTDGDILCYTPVGTSTVALSCFTLNGAQLWLECQANINSTGANTNPVVTADLSGGVYVAYETTATVNGGAIVTGQQVEMVKFQTTLTPSNTLASYSRQWVLSQNGTIQTTPPGTSSAPSVTFDGTNVYIAFLTTGSVDGNYPTGSAHDLVVAQITPTGYTPWIQQGNQFNRTPYIYFDAALPYITADYNLAANDVPNILVSLQTYTAAPQEGDSSIFIFKMSSVTGDNIFDKNGYNNMPLAWTSAQQTTALLPTAAAGTYSQVAVKAIYGALYFLLGSLVPLPFNVQTSCEADLILLKYNLAYYYPNTNPFEFMSQIKKICSCGANCSCQGTPTIPGAPFNLSSISGNASARIYFTIADGGSPLINFSYSIDNGTTFTPFAPPQYESPVTISGLTNGTTYSIQIKATNGIGTGPASATVTATPGLPDAPTNLDIQPGNTTAVITFTPGSGNGAPITNYTYSLDGGTTFVPFSPPQTTSPITISGLTNGTLYTIQLAAINIIGTGPATANLYVRPGTPTSVTNLAVVSAGDTVVTLSFTPGSNNGYALTNYAYSKNGGATFFLFSPPQTSSPVTVSGLTNGTTYTFQLEGQNTYGLGPTSASVTATPGLPGVPTSLSAVGGNNSVIITFTAGINNGSAITNYLYSVDDGAFTALSPADASSPVTISGLTTVGNTYSIQLKAVNAAGTSVASAAVTSTIGNPAPPTALSGAPGDTTAVISFTAGSNGGYAITNYAYSTDNGGTFTDFSPSQTTSPVTISGLTNYTAYTIKLKAKNSVAYSAASAAVTVTPQQPPLVLLQASSYSGSGAWLDQSGNGNDATLTAGIIAKNTAGNGIVLDGSTYWTFPNVSAGTTWTMSVWYKNVAPVFSDGNCVLSQQYIGTINMAIAINSGTPYGSFYGGFYSGAWYYGTPFEMGNVWTYYQITWDGTLMKTYINGTLLGTTTPGGTSASGTGNYYIGHRWDNSDFVIGEIGEVRIYNIPLTPTQILGDYNSTVSTYSLVPTPLVLLQASSYSGSGTWLDTSGNGFNATKTVGTIAKNGAGNGIVLNGSTYWSFPDVKAGFVWTLCVWYKNTGTPGSIYPCIVTAGNDGGNSNMLLGFTSSPSLLVMPAFYQGGPRYDGSSVTLTNNVWKNIQVTWDGTTMKTYTNGTLSGTTTPGGSSWNANGNLPYKIGICWDEGTNSFVTGEIGEVRIYGVPLTQAQITTNFTNTRATYGI